MGLAALVLQEPEAGVVDYIVGTAFQVCQRAIVDSDIVDSSEEGCSGAACR